MNRSNKIKKKNSTKRVILYELVVSSSDDSRS